MWDFKIATAFGLLRRTAPFLLFRMAVYGGIAVGYVLATALGAAIGWGLGLLGDSAFQEAALFRGGIVGFVIMAGILYLLREYPLYLVRAGHLAVMVADLDDAPVPRGRAQIAHGSDVVKTRFTQASVLFAVDRMTSGVVRTVTGLVQGITSLLPIPGLQSAPPFLLRSYLNASVGRIDELILAHAIRSGSDNPWSASRVALVFYAQNARPMLSNAAWLTAFTWAMTLIVFLLILTPAAAAIWLIPGVWPAGGLVFAVIFTWAIKVALIDPFAIACLLQVFFKLTDAQVPNPDWEEKLDTTSDSFRAMALSAAEWAPPAARGADPDRV